MQTAALPPDRRFTTRLRRLTTAAIATSLLITTSVLSPVSAAAAGLCGPATHGNFHVVSNKFAAEVSATYFDLVRGDLTVRNLDVCVGVGNGGTFMLAGNLETNAGTVVQIGYGQCAGAGGKVFVYAHGPVTAITWPNYAPITGDRYRFAITRVVEPGGQVVTAYKIQNLDKATASAIEFNGWYAGLNHAWWGAETFENASAHGVLAGAANQNLAYMGYSSNVSGSIVYRSGLVCGDIFKNFVWDGSNNNNGCNGTRHGHMGNWVYGGDKLAPETH